MCEIQPLDYRWIHNIENLCREKGAHGDGSFGNLRKRQGKASKERQCPFVAAGRRGVKLNSVKC